MTSERIAHFLREWNAAILRYEESDRECRRITADYLAQVDTTRPVGAITRRRQHEGLTVVEATQLASQDVYRKRAAAARDQSAERAMMYGISVLVEVLARDRAEQA